MCIRDSFLSAGVGLLRPEDVGDVLVADVGSPVFSMAFAAVTFVPAAGVSGFAASLAVGFAAGAGLSPPMLRTFEPPPPSTLGFGASAPIERVFAPIGFEAGAGAGAVEGEGAVSAPDGRFAILGVCWGWYPCCCGC